MRLLVPGEFGFQRRDAFALFGDALLGGLVGVQQSIHQHLSEFGRESRQEFAGVFVLLVERQAACQDRIPRCLRTANSTRLGRVPRH